MLCIPGNSETGRRPRGLLSLSLKLIGSLAPLDRLLKCPWLPRYIVLLPELYDLREYVRFHEVEPPMIIVGSLPSHGFGLVDKP